MTLRTQVSPYSLVGDSIADRPDPAGVPQGFTFYDTSTGVFYILVIDPLTNFHHWDAIPGGGSGGIIEFFADAVNGNDANPGTQALPVKTVFRMSKLSQSIPYYAGLMHLHFAPGTYPLDQDITSFLLPARQGEVNNATLARGNAQCLSFIGAYQNAGFGTRAVTAVTANSIADNTLVVAPDTIFGLRIRMLTGAAAGRTFCIADNTVGGVLKTLTDPLNAPVVAPGDQFVIERPSVVFQGNSPNNTVLEVLGSGNAAMIGIQIDNSAVEVIGGTIFNAETCMFTTAVILGIQNVHIAFRTVNCVDPTITIGSNVLNDSVGCLVTNGGIEELFAIQFNGSVVMRGGAVIFVTNSSACTPDAVDNPDGQILVQNGCQFNPSNFSVRSRVQFVSFVGAAIGTMQSYDISNPGNLAFLVDSNSHAEIDGCTITGNITAQDSSSLESTLNPCTINGSVTCFENSIADFDGAVVDLTAATDAVHLEHGSRLLLRNGTVHSHIDHAIFASENSEVNLDGCAITSDLATGIEVNRFSSLILTNTSVSAPGVGQTGVIVNHMCYAASVGGAGANPVSGGGQDWLIDGVAATNAAAAAGINGAFNSRVDDGA